MKPLLLIGSCVSLCASISISAADAPSYPRPNVGEVSPSVRNIQRTMRLLATSTPEHRNTVRVLFYGQSITEQKWSQTVAEDLKQRFPNANLIIENRAIGGHSSQLLVKTAEADLYPFQPDLLIFHVYGAHDKYADIIRRVRERTCAEILQQNDHVTKPEHLTEETDGSKLAPGKGSWDAFMNYNWLPSLAQKYQTAFCDQRAVWKRYLNENHLPPSALLKDSVHLNPHGEYLMAEVVKAHLVYDPARGESPAEKWVKTLDVGKDVQWQNGKLTLPFTGNRVDLITKSGTASAASVRIDGKKPTTLPGVYSFTRTTAYPKSNWPCLLKVDSQAPLQEEEWTLTLREVSPDLKTFKFDLAGSKTGPDGSGERSQRFISNSGRVVIDPADWNFDFALKIFKKPVEDGFQIKWKAVPHAVDEITATAEVKAGEERSVTVAQGLPNASHVLEVTGGPESAVSAIRIYTPPLQAAVE